MDSPSKGPGKTPDEQQGKPRGKRLRLIGREPLETALDLAVSRALRRTMPVYETERVSAIQDIVRTEFALLLKNNGRTVRGVGKSEFLAELERSRNQIIAARDRAKSELDEVRERMEFLRGIVGAEGGDAGSAPTFESAFERPFLRILEGSTVEPMARKRILGELSEAARRIARAEWERAAAARRELARERIDRYERRIAKLKRSMERTEDALDRLASLREGDDGMASIYRVVQGLDEDEALYEYKQRLLREIFAANVTLQKERPHRR
ncbi:MAG TPA: hypothetical protein ENJ09_15770 [Planctomycetes bacterium]|nr:hypothetical protein [Planctomycetota bacterium]